VPPSSNAPTPRPEASAPLVPETRYAEANGLTIAYETFGAPDDPPMLMIMGLGTQMIAWSDELCRSLADLGYYVIRYDNRDVGLSTHLDGVRVPGIADLVLRRKRPPYSLTDMAADAAGLLDALGIDSAHVVGASLGGFIAQTVAVEHPKRVRSLSLFMTSTGSRLVGRPKPSLLRRLARGGSSRGRAGAIEAAVETFTAIGSPGFPLDEEHLRDLAGRSYDRAHDVRGYQRQLAVSITQPNRSKLLRNVRVPTVVIHGLADPLVGADGGRAVARAIPGAKFVAIPGRGHDLPRALWPRFVEEISAVATEADSTRRRESADR
jgi:pimeloyl-ACP methyl ester carboxylesterase